MFFRFLQPGQGSRILRRTIKISESPKGALYRLVGLLLFVFTTATEMKTLLSVIETSKVLGISTRTVYRLLKNGELPAKKIGGQWRIYADELLSRDDNEVN